MTYAGCAGASGRTRSSWVTSVPGWAATAAQGYVSGNVAGQLDFRDQVASRLPIIILVVILAAILLLLVCFRSPVMAIKAALLNLLARPTG